MKKKTIKAVLSKKINEWAESIEDEDLRKRVLRDTIVTGGSIASMLLKEQVNDFDVYFLTKETAKAVAEYYVAAFIQATGHSLSVQEDESGRIKIATKNGFRGETAGDVTTLDDPGEIEDIYTDTEEEALEEKGKYRPVFLSTNAITLSNRIQIVIRFYGKPDEIHENYDFVHCTNYWTAHDSDLVLRQEALEALLAKELFYVGSKYPVCSVMRLRKFIKRGWTVNAGQILKMCLQIADLDLTNPRVLEDQLTGVDSAYFCHVIEAVKEKNPEKINGAYLVEIIDRMFG